jgi:hypothetical protein
LLPFRGRCLDAGAELRLFHGRRLDADTGLPLPLVSPAAERGSAPGGSSVTSREPSFSLLFEPRIVCDVPSGSSTRK